MDRRGFEEGVGEGLKRNRIQIEDGLKTDRVWIEDE